MLVLALPIAEWSLKVSEGWPDDPPGGNRFVAAMFAGPAGMGDPANRMAAIRDAVEKANELNEQALGGLGLGLGGGLEGLLGGGSG